MPRIATVLLAPRVLQTVKGDFSVQVRVTGDFLPGINPTVNGCPFNGAKWTHLRTVSMELADEISVGLAAVNSSNNPFTAEFEIFELKRK